VKVRMMGMLQVLLTMAGTLLADDGSRSCHRLWADTAVVCVHISPCNQAWESEYTHTVGRCCFLTSDPGYRCVLLGTYRYAQWNSEERSLHASTLKAVVADTDFEKAMIAVAGKVVVQFADQASLLGSHVASQDLRYKPSHIDLKWLTLILHKIVEMDNLASMKMVVNRSGSYRTAKEPSCNLTC
jgi:hypothetical protein